jgi:hypothetical protein
VTGKPTNGRTNTSAKEHISKAITVLHPIIDFAQCAAAARQIVPGCINSILISLEFYPFDGNNLVVGEDSSVT